MQVTVSEKMKEWVAGYIRSHRKEGTISLHVVFSKFNEDFRATFNEDPQVAIRLMEASGFLKGGPSKGGYSIWLTEDAGKGKGRPFRPRKAEVNGTVAQTNAATHQNGESEMKTKTKKEEISIEPHYSFERVPHPKTGKADVLEMIVFIMQQLGAKLPEKPEMDGGYAIMKLSIETSLIECGLSASQAASMSRILQEMALIKSYQRSMWGVLHPKATAYFITARSYLLARQAYLDRNRRNSELSHLRKQLQQPEGGAETSEAKTSSTLFDDEALEILAEAERLAEELQKTQMRISELEVERDRLQDELAERPTSVDAAKEALKERIAALKKVSAS